MSGGPFIFWQATAEVPTGPGFALWNTALDAQGYDFDGTDITEKGDADPVLTIATADRGQITALTDIDVAVAGSDGFNDRELGKYTFDGTNWSLVGNILTLTNSLVSCTGLGPNRVCLTFENAGMRTMDFDGTDWSQTGNIDISQTANDIYALTSTRVVNFNTGGNQLRAVDFDGTDWANDFTTNLGFEVAGICSMTSTRVAVFDRDNDLLYAYDDTGAAWTVVGNGFSIPSQIHVCMCPLSATRIVLGSNADGTLDVYDFDGTDWTQVGNQLTLVGVPEGRDLTNMAYLLI